MKERTCRTCNTLRDHVCTIDGDTELLQCTVCGDVIAEPHIPEASFDAELAAYEKKACLEAGNDCIFG